MQKSKKRADEQDLMYNIDLLLRKKDHRNGRKQLMEYLGCDRRTVGKLINATWQEPVLPRAANLIKILEFFECTPGELFTTPPGVTVARQQAIAMPIANHQQAAGVVLYQS